jgi:hypothetical protein
LPSCHPLSFPWRQRQQRLHGTQDTFRAYRHCKRYCATVPWGMHPRSCRSHWAQPHPHAGAWRSQGEGPSAELRQWTSRAVALRRGFCKSTLARGVRKVLSMLYPSQRAYQLNIVQIPTLCPLEAVVD